MLLRTVTVVALLLVGCRAVDDDVFLLSKASNLFSTNLYQTLISEDGNIAISPFSVATLLSIAWLGAEGFTAHDLKKSLHLKNSRPEVEEAFKQLLTSLQLSKAGVTLNFKNRAFIQRNFGIHENFRRSISTNFLSNIQQVDFSDPDTARKTINNWVKNVTNNKIPSLISRDALGSGTKLILTSAIYFSGDWLKPFTETENKMERFYMANGRFLMVPMMYQVSSFPIRTFKNLGNIKVIKLPYSNQDMSMLVFLPNNRNELDCLEARLSLLNITDIVRSLREQQVEITIPKFKIDLKLSLKDALSKMGLQDVFDENADFSGITNVPIHVNDVLQKTVIEVTEKGTEAASASEMEMVDRSGGSPVIFKANRPFIFMIYDERMGTILFIGRFSKPNEMY